LHDFEADLSFEPSFYGTEGYRSPEVMADEDDLPPRDIWAFGITISKMVYDCLPFDLDSMKNISNSEEFWDHVVVDFNSICESHKKKFPCNENCKFLKEILSGIFCRAEDRFTASKIVKMLSSQLKTK